MYLPAAFGIASLGLPIFAVFYGLDWIATVPPTLRLTTDRFGRLRAPLMFGWIFTGHQLGASLIAYIAGVIRTGSLAVRRRRRHPFPRSTRGLWEHSTHDEQQARPNSRFRT